VRLLLDTHVFLWWASNAPELSDSARALISDPASTVFVSAATAWEVAIKAGQGRLDVPKNPERFFADQLERHNFWALEVSFAHTLAVRGLPDHHQDPFDRLLVAQAQIEGLTLVSADPAIPLYGVPVAW